MTEPKTITTRLPADLVKRLKVNAFRTQRKIGKVIEDALTEHLATRKESRPENGTR